MIHIFTSAYNLSLSKYFTEFMKILLTMAIAVSFVFASEYDDLIEKADNFFNHQKFYEAKYYYKESIDAVSGESQFLSEQKNEKIYFCFYMIALCCQKMAENEPEGSQIAIINFSVAAQLFSYLGQHDLAHDSRLRCLV